ncbi:MAG: CoA transferase [Pseudomonadota bacterium]
MSDEAQPFTGIRVVEFGQFVAVPFCAQLLSDGGADVIKVESLQGDPTRHFSQLAPGQTRVFLSRNRGKRSLPLSLRAEGASLVLDALLAWADVVLTNFRPGLAVQFGLDAESLAKSHPSLIVGNVTAFGTKGPDANLAGMDIVVQARSGLMTANGRTVDGRPASGDPVSADYMCATTLAFGVASALLRRERTGRGGSIDVSLMHAAMALANNQLIRSEHHDRAEHEAAKATLSAQRIAGVSYEEQAESLPASRPIPFRYLYFRTYDTADGTVAVACIARKLREAFIETLGFSDKGLDDPDPSGREWQAYYHELRTQCEVAFRKRSGAEWIATFSAIGVPIGEVRFPLELFDDEQALANEMIVSLDHPEIGELRVVGPTVRMDGDGFRAKAPTAPLGVDTYDVLRDIGLSAEDVDTLIQSNVTKRNTE